MRMNRSKQNMKSSRQLPVIRTPCASSFVSLSFHWFQQSFLMGCTVGVTLPVWCWGRRRQDHRNTHLFYPLTFTLLYNTMISEVIHLNAWYFATILCCKLHYLLKADITACRLFWGNKAEHKKFPSSAVFLSPAHVATMLKLLWCWSQHKGSFSAGKLWRKQETELWTEVCKRGKSGKADGPQPSH